jgi:RNA polymerase sigma factor (sigma-70 family)
MENFEEAYTKYWRYVCAMINRRLKNIDPSDIAQKVFFALMRQPVMPPDVKNWLIRSTINECITYYKHRLVVNSYEKYATYAFSNATRLEENEKLIHDEQGGRIELLKLEINKLPSKSRRAFCLFYLHGLKHKEIAAMMNTRVSTVSNHIKNARDTLRETLT